MEMTERRAKLFRNGGSQAVRLPKEFQFVGTEVLIRRSGNDIVLEPVRPREPEFPVKVDEAVGKLEGVVEK
jgi:antitoxin VapB